MLTRIVLCALFALMSINASAGGAPSAAEYAKGCAAEMGKIQEFNCMTGTILPITVNGVDSSSVVTACDKPIQLGIPDSTQCTPFARLLKLDTGNANVLTLAICRKYRASPTGPTDSGFQDIAVIQHNRATGNTCFFQSPVGKEQDGTTVPSPSTDATSASPFWDPPEVVRGIHCTSCHDADPFIWSPYVAQVADVPKWDPLGKWNSNFLDLFGDTVSTFKPAGNACASCHRIGSNTCSTFVQEYTVLAKMASTHPGEFWMPPNFTGSSDLWHKQNDTAMAQLARCCSDPSASECASQSAGGISTTKDQCGEELVQITDKNGTVQKVAKGNGASFHPAANRFAWFCGTDKGERTQESTTCADGTNQVAMSRAADGRKINWKCFKRSEKILLEQTGDKCSAKYVRIKDKDGTIQKIAKGKSGSFAPGSNSFNWWCGEGSDWSKESATCKSGTNFVEMSRESEGRDIHWNCISKGGADNHVLLEETGDECSRALVEVNPATGGPLAVKKGKGATFDVASNKFPWWCSSTGNWTQEFTTCPTGTTSVQMKRAPSGREIVWSCSKN